MEPKYFYAKIKIDGRCVDLLLTQTEVTRSYNRAKENHGIMDAVMFQLNQRNVVFGKNF